MLLFTIDFVHGSNLFSNFTPHQTSECYQTLLNELVNATFVSNSASNTWLQYHSQLIQDLIMSRNAATAEASAVKDGSSYGRVNLESAQDSAEQVGKADMLNNHLSDSLPAEQPPRTGDIPEEYDCRLCSDGDDTANLEPRPRDLCLSNICRSRSKRDGHPGPLEDSGGSRPLSSSDYSGEMDTGGSADDAGSTRPLELAGGPFASRLANRKVAKAALFSIFDVLDPSFKVNAVHITQAKFAVKVG